MDDDISKSIYANVKARLDYAILAIGQDLDLSLKDVTFLEMKITNEDIVKNVPSSPGQTQGM
jgi:hypothetical protein